jgi:type I restriction enzyme S subunit
VTAELPEGFKMTEIGLVPETWGVVKTKETGNIITGTTPSTKVTKYYNGPYMFISPGDINGSKYVIQTKKYLSEEGLKVSRPLPKNSVLVVCIGATIGKTTLTSAERSTTNQQINAIVPNDSLSPYFLYYVLLFRSPYLPSLAGRSAVPIVNKSNFSDFIIPLPPLPEQHRIAAVLSAVQDAKEKTGAVIAAAKSLKKSLMRHLALPTLPSMGTGNDADFLVHGIKVSDMNLPQNEREILGANIEVRLPKGVAEKKAIPPMSTVFPKRGAAIATNKKRLTTTWTILDPNLIAVVPGSGVNPYFLYYWFLIFDIKSIQSPGPTPQLNKKDVEPVQFPLPPLHTQQKIASILSTVDKKIEAEENKKIALDELFKSLLHNLMTGKIRVNHLEVTQ